MSRVFAQPIVPNRGVDWITVTKNASINNLAAYTYAAWIYPTALPATATANASSQIFSKDWAVSAFFAFCYGNFDAAHTPLTATIFGPEPGFGNLATSSSVDGVITLNTWQRVVAAFDFNGDKKFHLYVNGSEVAYVTPPTTSLILQPNDSVGDLLIGNDTTTFEPFVGDVQGAELWDVALTASEVASDYTGGSPQAAHLIASLTFSTDQGSPEPDASGHNNTGAITGAAFSANNPPPPGPPPPAPATVNPVSGIPGQTITNFTVTGTNFDVGGTSTLSFSGTGITVNSYGTRNATTLVANITITAGAARTARDVIITNADAQTGTLAGGFTITVPSRCYNTGPASTQVDLPFSVTLLATDNFDVPSPVIVDTVVTLSVFTGTGALAGIISGTIIAGQSTATISGVEYNVAENGVEFVAASVSGDSLAGFLNGSLTNFFAPLPNPAAESGSNKPIMSTIGGTTMESFGTPFIGTLKNGGALIR